MRILVVSQYYPPEMAAGGVRMAEMVTEWCERGHEVSVLTAVPNYPDGVVRPEYRWKVRVTEEGPCGEKVHRVGLVPASSGNLLLRAVKFLSFSVTAWLIGMRLRLEPDIVVASSPPPTVGAVGRILAYYYDTVFVLDVRDIWPDAIVDVAEVPAVVVKVLDGLVGWLYRTAERIVVVSRAFERHIVTSCKLNRSDDIVFIPNGVDLDAFKREEQDIARIREEFKLPRDDLLLMYVGTFGLSQDLSRLEPVFKALCDEPVHICLVGGGVQQEQLLEMSDRIEALTVLQRQPRRRVPDLYHAADVGLVVLKDTPVMEMVIPSKVFEIMAARRPVLLVGGGEVRRIVEENNCGIYVEPNHSYGFVEAVHRLQDRVLRSRLGSAGQRSVRKYFSRKSLSCRYLEVFKDTVPLNRMKSENCDRD
jgi:glycosyltransferase involved in cell wall biosynthesis